MMMESKAWHYFINAKLLPSSNFGEVTKDRAILNYAIHKSLSIDMGTVIQNNILHILRESTIAGLGYPSLIMTMQKMRCFDNPIKDVMHPKLAITNDYVWKFVSRQKFNSASPREMEAQPSRSCQTLPRPPPVRDISDDMIRRFEAMELRFTQGITE